MAKIAMKFGGTSVADLDRIRHVATLVKQERDRGNEVAVVVSAMAGETNKLIGWANEIAKSPGSNFPAMPDQREQDVIVASGEQVTAGLLSVALGALSHVVFDFVSHENVLWFTPFWEPRERVFPAFWYARWFEVRLPGYAEPHPIGTHFAIWIVLSVVGAWLFFRRPNR